MPSASSPQRARTALTAGPYDRSLALWLRAAWLLSLGLTVLRLDLTKRIGFGDAEALYAAYALHPQPAYLDHPGLIGAIFRLISAGDVPNPFSAHLLTSLAAGAFPWFGFAAARLCGAPTRRALWCFFGLALMPLLLVGTFALTPDLPLAYAWLGALACATFAATRPEASWSALLATILCGACVGFAAWSKASGALVGLGLLAASLTPPLRKRWLTLAPWSALVVSVILVIPIVTWEMERGWPLLVHRFVATQGEAGLSLRNVGAFIGGQLLYITPPFLVMAWYIGKHAWTERQTSRAVLVLGTVLVPAVLLGSLCLWSRVAEPHWFAPVYLGIVFYAPFVPSQPAPSGAESITDGESPGLSRPWAAGCVAVGIAVAGLSYSLVRTPWLTQFMAWQSARFGTTFEPRYDLSNDLYAWNSGQRFLQESLGQVARETLRMPILFGPHWTICAQVSVALPKGLPIGCLSPNGDDYANWTPLADWLGQSPLIYVTDDRFDRGLRDSPTAASEQRSPLPGYRIRSRRRTSVQRGGQTVRIISATWLERIQGVARSAQ